MLLYTKSASCAAYVCGRSAGLLLQFLAAVCSDYCCWSFGLSPIALKGYLLLGVKKYIQSTIHKCVVLHINTVYVDVSYTYKVRGECIFAYNWCVDVVRVARGCASLEGGVVAAKAKVITYIYIYTRGYARMVRHSPNIYTYMYECNCRIIYTYLYVPAAWVYVCERQVIARDAQSKWLIYNQRGRVREGGIGGFNLQFAFAILSGGVKHARA